MQVAGTLVSAGCLLENSPDDLKGKAIMHAAVAAIEYAIDMNTDDGLYFLMAWHQGDFDVCRRDWPDAPDDCYIGADPLHPGTKL